MTRSIKKNDVASTLFTLFWFIAGAALISVFFYGSAQEVENIGQRNQDSLPCYFILGLMCLGLGGIKANEDSW